MMGTGVDRKYPRWRSISTQADAFAEAKASPTRWQRLRFALTERESDLHIYVPM
jgi:hypothetical protein